MYSFVFFPILLNKVLYGVLCLINAGSIFTVYSDDIKEHEFGIFLEFIVKYR